MAFTYNHSFNLITCLKSIQVLPMGPMLIKFIFESVQSLRTYHISRKAVPWVNDSVGKKVLVFLTVKPGFLYITMWSGRKFITLFVHSISAYDSNVCEWKCAICTVLYGADCALSRSIHLSHKRLCYAQERYASGHWFGQIASLDLTCMQYHDII